MENLLSLSRTKLHERACDAIAAEGRKPSIGTVRAWTLANAGIKRGSDGDAQSDINAWFACLLALKRQKPIPSLPPALSELFSRVWTSALEAAQSMLSEERHALETEKTHLQRMVANAEAKSQQLAGELTIATAQIESTYQKLVEQEEMIVQLSAQLADQRAISSGKDERINGLTADIGRLHVEYKAHFSMLAANEEKAEARLAAQERRAMLEIDKARTAEREANERVRETRESVANQVELSRRRTSVAETEAATLRGRSERLAEEVASSAGRIKQLEKELSREREAAAHLAMTQSKGAAPVRRVISRRLRAVDTGRRRKP